MTPLQITAAVAAVANGGYLMRPFVVRAGRRTRRARAASTQPVRGAPRAGSRHGGGADATFCEGRGRATARARHARHRRLRVAGKTGTARRSTPSGRYSMIDHVASFVGFAPADALRPWWCWSRSTRRAGPATRAATSRRPSSRASPRTRCAQLGVPPGRPRTRPCTRWRRPGPRRPRPCRRPRSAAARAAADAGADARPARSAGARSRRRRGAPRPGRGAARLGPGGAQSPEPGTEIEPGLSCLADARPGAALVRLADVVAPRCRGAEIARRAGRRDRLGDARLAPRGSGRALRRDPRRSGRRQRVRGRARKKGRRRGGLARAPRAERALGRA